VYLGLSRVVHVREGFADHVERDQCERDEDNEDPAKGSVAENVERDSVERGKYARSPPAQRGIDRDCKKVKRDRTPKHAVPRVCETTPKTLLHILLACKGGPPPVDERL